VLELEGVAARAIMVLWSLGGDAACSIAGADFSGAGNLAAGSFGSAVDSKSSALAASDIMMLTHPLPVML
jgi:hypothetical protein